MWPAMAPLGSTAKGKPFWQNQVKRGPVGVKKGVSVFDSLACNIA
jgi:hypothetical protein